MLSNVVQVTTISNSLNRVEERFKTSPELIKVPHDLETLTTNIATFGSQMQDLVGTVAQLKEASGKLSLTTDTLQSNVSSIRVSFASYKNRYNQFWVNQWVTLQEYYILTHFYFRYKY